MDGQYHLHIISGPAKDQIVPYWGTPEILVVSTDNVWHDYKRNKIGYYEHSEGCKCHGPSGHE